MAEKTDLHPIIDKIVSAPPNTYIIFYVKECPYCRYALDLLRKSGRPYKGYNIHKIEGGMPKLLQVLNDHAKLINFDPGHLTKPIIFLNATFIGGSDKLSEHLEKTSQ